MRLLANPVHIPISPFCRKKLSRNLYYRTTRNFTSEEQQLLQLLTVSYLPLFIIGYYSGHGN
jgi:hypothetical protein